MAERKDTLNWIVLGGKGPSRMVAAIANAIARMEDNASLPILVQHFMAEFVIPAYI